MNSDSDFWDDPFHVIAFEAYVAEARKCGTFPKSEDVKNTAYSMYAGEYGTNE